MTTAPALPVKKTADDSKKNIPSGISKELEQSRLEEDKLMSEIVVSSEAIDDKAEKEAKEALSEAKRSQPEPSIPPDVADAGMKSPLQEAESVIKKGSTIELPISQDLYEKGLHQKVGGFVVNKVVVGISSLYALASWAGRMIKILHKHSMRVVFRRPPAQRASGPEGDQ